ncbi:MAG: hypothetical protein M3440_00720 [Chloroflexota bacterium]|nr:hypothetical protein [Chloroflexota bacterium]
MMTVLAIAILIIVAGLFVAMAVTPMVAETERWTVPSPQWPVPLERPAAVPPKWDNHQHAA